MNPKPMPNPATDALKEEFVHRYGQLLKEDYERFIQYSFSYARKSIRVNTLKITVEELCKKLSERWHLTPIPWCPTGFWIDYKGDKDQEQRFDLGNLPEHMLGYFYVQDAASMIPPVVLQPKEGELLLDLCAAPGSKTSQIAAMMNNTGLIIANDLQSSRLRPLAVNLQRVGVRNTVLTLMAGQSFKKKTLSFDKVLVDAPCSGTGTIRRSSKVLRMWSPRLVRRLVKDQRTLLQTGFDVLKEGGTLVYSTCTQEPEENEGVVTWLLQNNPDAELLDIKLDITRSYAVKSFEGVTYHPDITKCLRIYPYDNDTEGFFVAKIKKHS